MNPGEVLRASSRTVALPSQQSPTEKSPSLDSGDPYLGKRGCIYCRRSQLACDLETPCTRCIKRKIGHLCHDEPPDANSKKRKWVEMVQIVQFGTTSLVSSNLKSCHYTISQDHTEGEEDQKCKILAEFGRKRVRAWTKLSLANVNSPNADPDTSAKVSERLLALGNQSGLLHFHEIPKRVQVQGTPIAAPTQSNSFTPLLPSEVVSSPGSSPSPLTRVPSIPSIRGQRSKTRF